MTLASEMPRYAADAPVGERPRRLLLVWLLGCSVLVFLGWRLFWHLTDDAYIIFRYVSNSMAGRGLVWNPEPFAAVDGTTEFLWALVLQAVWVVLGIEPPDAANAVSLAFGYGTFALVCMLAWRTRLPTPLARQRSMLVAVLAVAVATNRVFLASLSSGLGTALFQFCLLAWISSVLWAGTRWSMRSAIAITTAAALSALARPDGYLVVMASVLLLCRQAWLQRGSLMIARAAAMGAPLLLVAAHLSWRRHRYGAWLPNPYYAKHAEAWPESGVRYAASFVLEYGVWVWVLIAAFWAVNRLRVSRHGPRPTLGMGHVAVIAVIATHFLYYTFVIGGDVFEYRVYSHLFPLLLLSTVAMARDLASQPRHVVLMTAAFALAAQPVPWIKWSANDGPIAAEVPAVVRPVAALHDGWQDWLHAHFVCQRNHTLRMWYRIGMESMPSRRDGEQIGWETRPVLKAGAVGFPGWALPNVAIIDEWGLNDYVIARHPIGTQPSRQEGLRDMWSRLFEIHDTDHDGRIAAPELAHALERTWPDLDRQVAAVRDHVRSLLADFDVDRDGSITRHEVLLVANPSGERRMAHDRRPPAGYVEGFRPNVLLQGREIVVLPREQPLTDAEIRAHETKWRRIAGSWR